MDPPSSSSISSDSNPIKQETRPRDASNEKKGKMTGEIHQLVISCLDCGCDWKSSGLYRSHSYHGKGRATCKRFAAGVLPGLMSLLFIVFAVLVRFWLGNKGEPIS